MRTQRNTREVKVRSRCKDGTQNMGLIPFPLSLGIDSALFFIAIQKNFLHSLTFLKITNRRLPNYISSIVWFLPKNILFDTIWRKKHSSLAEELIAQQRRK